MTFPTVCVCVFVPKGLTSGCHVGDLGLLVSRNVHVEKMSHSHSSHPGTALTIDITFGLARLCADAEWLQMFLMIQQR